MRRTTTRASALVGLVATVFAAIVGSALPSTASGDPTVSIRVYQSGVYRETDVIYPVVDGHFDVVYITVSDATESLKVTIRDPSGVVVFQGSDSEVTPGYSVGWNGHGADSRALPAGTYEVTATSRGPDQGLFDTVQKVDLKVSHRHIVRKVWRGSVRFNASLVETTEEPCGWLKRPARTNWKGSIGYYTTTRCGRIHLNRVTTRNRVSLPRSFTNEYGRIRVVVVGGKARAEKRSSLGIVYGYDGFGPPAGKVHRFSGTFGRHAGDWAPAAYYIEAMPGIKGLVFEWNTRASRGDRYDVKKFIIELEYDVFD